MGCVSPSANGDMKQCVGQAGPCNNTLRSVCPSSNGITRKGWPSCSPNSWRVQMLGWSSAEAARFALEALRPACPNFSGKFQRDSAAQFQVFAL